jgi:hypothetical protein
MLLLHLHLLLQALVRSKHVRHLRRRQLRTLRCVRCLDVCLVDLLAREQLALCLALAALPEP